MTEPASPSPASSSPAPGAGAPWRRLVLSWFGCGRAPVAPGTLGTLGALPVAWLIHAWAGPWGLGVAAAGLFVVGWRLIDREVPGADSDPGWIVVDEVAGVWLALATVPLSLPWYAAAFALFRLFDIWKPWPIGKLDREVGGGLGVMLDDVLAGLYAAGIALIARAALP